MASASHFPAARASSEPQNTELDRLERAIRVLIEERGKLLHENESMREELESMQGLQDRLRDEAELRRTALARIDELVGWIEQLEPALGTAGDGARADAGTRNEGSE